MPACRCLTKLSQSGRDSTLTGFIANPFDYIAVFHQKLKHTKEQHRQSPILRQRDCIPRTQRGSTQASSARDAVRLALIEGFGGNADTLCPPLRMHGNISQ